MSLRSRARLLRDPVGRAVLRGDGPAAERLRDALGRKPDAAERAWVERIETARRELSERRDRIGFELPDGPSEREVGELCSTSSVSTSWALLLFRLVRALRPERCLELGSCVGISAAYQAAALDLNGTGRLVTIEGRPEVAAIAAQTVAFLGLGDRVDQRVGWFADVLDDAVTDLGEVDHAFVDGHHDGGATLDYFARIAPRLSSGAVVVMDDITWSDDMRDAWRTIVADEATADAVDLGRLGVWRRR